MEHILVFTKYPIAGFAKTRLIPSLGPEGAAEVSRKLSERCMQSVRDYVQYIPSTSSVSIRIFYTGKDADPVAMERWLGRESYEVFLPQCEGDLGLKMSTAFESSFAAGATKTIIVGTDIPEMSANVLRTAFAQLEENDVVVGPAVDGGYYLLGMRSMYQELFENIQWSTANVLKETKDRAQRSNLVLSELNLLRDIDVPNDLAYLSRFIDIPATAEKS